VNHTDLLAVLTESIERTDHAGKILIAWIADGVNAGTGGWSLFQPVRLLIKDGREVVVAWQYTPRSGFAMFEIDDLNALGATPYIGLVGGDGASAVPHDWSDADSLWRHRDRPDESSETYRELRGFLVDLAGRLPRHDVSSAAPEFPALPEPLDRRLKLQSALRRHPEMIQDRAALGVAHVKAASQTSTGAIRPRLGTRLTSLILLLVVGLGALLCAVWWFFATGAGRIGGF
jgi:hypothetical protein